MIQKFNRCRPIEADLSRRTCQGGPVEAVRIGEAVEVLDFVEVRQHANCWLDHSFFLKKQWSPLCIRSGEETCWLHH